MILSQKKLRINWGSNPIPGSTKQQPLPLISSLINRYSQFFNIKKYFNYFFSEIIIIKQLLMIIQ